MSGSPPESSGSEGFDPYRRRREIEAMEQRFRERAERHGGGPVATGEIDQKVADEMRQFFSESTERAAKVVPNLDDASGGGMRETTGEIRRKIESFFAQVKDAGGGAATPDTQELQSKRGRWSGYFPGGPGAAQDPAAQNPPALQPLPSDDDPPRPTLMRTRPPQTEPVTTSQIPRMAPVAPQVQPPAPRRSSQQTPQYPAPQPYQQQPHPYQSQPQYQPRAAAPARPQPAAEDPVPEAPAAAAPGDGAKMDLKTALEKLRRSGSGAAGAALAAGEAAPAPRPEMTQRPTRLPPRPASMQPKPAAPPPAAPPAPAPPPSRPAAAPAPAPRAAAAPPVAPSNVPPRRESTAPVLLPSDSVEPSHGPATTSVPVVPPRREAVRPGDGSAPKRPADEAARRDAPEARRPPMRIPSAAAAGRAKVAASLAGQRRDGVAPPIDRQLPKPVDRQLPRGPGVSVSGAAPAADEAPRKSESPIRSVRRDPVDAAPAASSPEAAEEPKAPRVPSASARSFAQSFNKDVAASRDAAVSRDAAASQRPAAPRADAPRADPVRAAPTPVRVPKPSADPPKQAGPDPASSFDDIFNELQGLVLETLHESVDESFAVARNAEPGMREATSEIGPTRAEEAPWRRQPEPEPESALVATPDPTAGQDAEPASDAGADASADDESNAPDARGFARPEDDDSDEAEPAPEAAPAPYDWGVRKAPRPQGAWLVEGEEAAGASRIKPAPSAAPAPDAAASVPAAEASPTVSMGAAGGRGYLQKKLGDEVRRFQPALQALRAKGLVDERDLADPDGQEPRRGGDDDESEEVSVESFKDRKPVDFDAELSPARLVEEIRRLRRLTDALVAKGVLTDDEIRRSNTQ